MVLLKVRDKEEPGMVVFLSLTNSLILKSKSVKVKVT
jgi:hypothetical protein